MLTEWISWAICLPSSLRPSCFAESSDRNMVKPTVQLRIMDRDFRNTWKLDFPKSIMRLHTISLLETCLLTHFSHFWESLFYKFYKSSFTSLCVRFSECIRIKQLQAEFLKNGASEIQENWKACQTTPLLAWELGAGRPWEASLSTQRSSGSCRIQVLINKREAVSRALQECIRPL